MSTLRDGRRVEAEFVGARASRSAGARDAREAELGAELHVSARLQDSMLLIKGQEINSKLHGIRLNASILERLKVDDPSASARLSESVGEIYEALAEVNALLDEFQGNDDGGEVDRSRGHRAQRVLELAEIARKVVEPLARHRGVTVSIEAEGSVTLACDRAQMVQVIAVMMVNGVRRAPRGASARFVCTRAGDATRMAVHDGGEALTPEGLRELMAPRAVTDGALRPFPMFAACRGVARHGGTLCGRRILGGGMVFEAVIA